MVMKHLYIRILPNKYLFVIFGSLGIGVVKTNWTGTSAENADKTIFFRSFLRFVYDYTGTNFELHGKSQRT